MAIQLTKEQKEYIKTSGKVILNACPGSGKTTVVGHKLFELTRNWEKDQGPYSGIACLSFTNVAKDEINDKFKEISGHTLTFPHLTSTIDSFVNRYITLPFSYLVLGNKTRLTLAESNRTIDDILQNMPSFKGNYKDYLWSYKPSTIEFNKDGNLYSTTGSGRAAEEKFNMYCKAVKSWQLKRGLIKTTDSAFIALKILKNYPKIASWLIQRFPHIIIDEAQDTSEIQDEIFNKLICEGLSCIEMVGDPYQAIFEWRDARPDLFIKKIDSAEWQTLHLTENKRSTQIIADTYCKLRSTSDPEIICTTKFKKIAPIKAIKYSDGGLERLAEIFKEICDKEGYAKGAVVARGGDTVRKVLGKREVQPWKDSELPFRLLRARKHFDNNSIKKAINEIRKATIKFFNADNDVIDLTEREEQRADYKMNAFLYKFLVNMPSLDHSVEDWTKLTERYFTQEFNLDESVCFGIKQARGGIKSKYTSADKSLPVHSLVEDLDYCDSISVSTIHKVKGKTFDALLLILSKNSSGEGISLNSINEANGIPDEKQRLIYVAMSRPKYLLAIGVPDSINNSLIKEKLGDNTIIVDADS